MCQCSLCFNWSMFQSILDLMGLLWHAHLVAMAVNKIHIQMHQYHPNVSMLTDTTHSHTHTRVCVYTCHTCSELSEVQIKRKFHMYQSDLLWWKIKSSNSLNKHQKNVFADFYYDMQVCISVHPVTFYLIIMTHSPYLSCQIHFMPMSWINHIGYANA